MNEKIFMQAGIGILLLGMFYFIFVRGNLEYTTEASRMEQRATAFIGASKKLKNTLEKVAEINMEVEYLSSRVQDIGSLSNIDEMANSLATQRKEIKRFLEEGFSFWGGIKIAWCALWGNSPEIKQKFEAFDNKLDQFRGVISQVGRGFDGFKEVGEKLKEDLEVLQEEMEKAGIKYERIEHEG